MWKIRQTNDGWQVLDSSGVAVLTASSYEQGVGYIATQVRAVLAAAGTAPDTAGVRWVSGDSGIVLQANTGDGRDFSECAFTWRPLDQYPLPLMLQTETEMGHFGAVMAGFIDTMSLRGDGGVDASGMFHATEEGQQALAILEAQGRMGVSVDPGQVDWEDVCTEFDPEGWCVDGFTKFLAYEVIGLTMTPFPAFGEAWIQLENETPAEEADPAEEVDPAETPEAVAAAGTVGPPAAYFQMVEPEVGDDRYVDQGEGRVAIPLTISEPDANGWRQVYGHAAAWGTCHIGYRDQCVAPPESQASYAHYHVGAVLTAEGDTIATGTLVFGLDHAGHRLAAPDAQDHYAHTGMAWADVRASNGNHGVWVCGAVRSTVTDEQVYVAQASALSGDWRTLGGHLEMVGCQSVNVPGFPIARQALAAAGLTQVADGRLRARYGNGGQLLELAAAGMVRPQRAVLDSLAASGTVDCLPCGQTRRAKASDGDLASELAAVRAVLATLELRTRHLIPAQREHLRARLTRNP